MLRRWLIRVPCLLALAFVVGVWITSYFGLLWMDRRSGGNLVEVGAVQGLVFMSERAGPPLYDTPLHRPGFAYADEPLHFWFTRGAKDVNYVIAPRMLGFGASPLSLLRIGVAIIFPLWLPTLLLAGLNWFVWRKTRAKPATQSGFPIEPAGKGATKP